MTPFWKTLSLSLLLWGSQWIYIFGACPQGSLIVPATLNKNTTWSSTDTAYCLPQTVTLSVNAALTIQPGVQVLFDADAPSGKPSLLIKGTVLARGKETQPIVFKSSRATPKPGDWGHLYWYASAANAQFDEAGKYLSGSILEFVTLAHGGGANKASLVAESAPYLKDVLIQNSLHGAAELWISTRIVHSTFRDNQNPESGGALAFSASGRTLEPNPTLWIQDSFFSKNQSSKKGGALYAPFGTITLQNSAFEQNQATENGGALYVEEHLKLAQTLFKQNQAAAGGAISSLSEPVVIETATFSENVATTRGSALDAPAVTLKNSLLYANQGPSVLYLFEGESVIQRSSFFYNFPTPTSTSGDAITLEPLSSVSLQISQSNLAGHTGYAIRNDTANRIQAKENYWGTSAKEVIGELIWDRVDQSGRGDRKSVV